MNVKRIAVSLLALLLLAASGCAPRGETRSVDELLVLARQRYAAVSRRGLSEDLTRSLDALTGLVEEVVASPSVLEERGPKIGAMLSALSERAGFTARPALGELINQYAAEHDASQKVASASVKLLAARSYSVLAAELETTRFAL